MRTGLTLSLAFLILLPFVCSAQQINSQEDRIQKLEQIILQQEQKIQDLQKKVVDVENQQPSREYTEQIVKEYMTRPEVQEAATVSAGYESRGFFIRSGDGNLEFYMSGLLQMGVGIFENSTYDRNSFYPNGVSLAFDAYFYKEWHARLSFNLWSLQRDAFQSSSGGLDNISLWDAYIEYIGIPEFNVRIGNTHVPFTMEGQYGPTEGISIWSEPYINSWSHGRDPGLMFLGTLGDMFEYKFSIHNGENGINRTDDMLMAAGFRLYPFKKSENPYTFFHVGVIRSRNSRDAADNRDAYLVTPWLRTVFDPVYAQDTTRGWKTGVDVAFRFDRFLDPEKVNQIRAELEFMYITWERDLATAGRLPYLNGYGTTIGLMFKHNMTPDVEGAGVFPMFKFSYSDIDDKGDLSETVNGTTNIYGQRAFVYTAGIGYSFNKFITANLNWVIVNLDEKEAFGGTKQKHDISDSLEQAWFFQVTAQW